MVAANKAVHVTGPPWGGGYPLTCLEVAYGSRLKAYAQPYDSSEPPGVSLPLLYCLSNQLFNEQCANAYIRYCSSGIAESDSSTTLVSSANVR